jgi:TrmH family RNA methyltransferase
MCAILNLKLKCSDPYCKMPMTEMITSAANPLVKEVRRAVLKGGLTKDGLCIAESVHLLEEALRSGREIAAVLVADSAQPLLRKWHRQLARIKVAVVPDGLLNGLSGTENTQGVMALVRPPAWEMEQVFGTQPLIVVLDGLQDPGNVGTVVRAAEAFGASGILALPGTASPHNPKTLRASAGSLFRVPYVSSVNPAAMLSAFREKAVELWAAVPAGREEPARRLIDADLASPCGLLIGNEAHGVSDAMRGAARALSIPTAGVESLNAAMAAAVLLYEARRQRTLPA